MDKIVLDGDYESPTEQWLKNANFIANILAGMKEPPFYGPFITSKTQIFIDDIWKIEKYKECRLNFLRAFRKVANTKVRLNVLKGNERMLCTYPMTIPDLSFLLDEEQIVKALKSKSLNFSEDI